MRLEVPMEKARHTRGPWRLEDDRILANERLGPLLVATVRRAKGYEAEGNANGALLAAAPELLEELLEELLRADVVIQTMLGLMTTEQKLSMAEVMEASLIAGEDATRHHERRAVIVKAHGTR
jgi:hypothetical protein